MFKKVAVVAVLAATVFAVSSAEARYVQSCSSRWVPDYPVYPQVVAPPVIQQPYYPVAAYQPYPYYPQYPMGHGHQHGNHVDWYN